MPRYRPRIGDPVIGVVIGRKNLDGTEYFVVDIEAASDTLLPVTAFPGASKKAHPAIYNGGVVLALVSSTPLPGQGTTTLLSCLCKWDTKSYLALENYVGVLCAGQSNPQVILESRLMSIGKVSEDLLESLRLGKGHEQFLKLGRGDIDFHIAVGRNGRLWLCPKDQEGKNLSSNERKIIITEAVRDIEALASRGIEKLTNETQ